MKKLYALLISIFCCGIFQLSAQNREVSGTVIDSAKITIPGAIVQLIANKDTLKTTTDKDGAFFFSKVKANQFSLIVAMMGYHTLSTEYTLEAKEGQEDLGNLTLKTSTRMLDEVVIKAKPNPVRFMRDTVEYNAEAYSVQDGDNVADLLKQLPDMEVDDEYRVKTMGKEMVKLRVNGKDFFTSNVKEFIAKLPAGIVSKLQVIDDFGDQANFTGIKIGEPRKMLNIVTKPGMNKGAFGNVSANTATNDRIGGNGNINIWNGDKQSAIDGGMNTADNGAGNSRSMNIGMSHNTKMGKYTQGGIGYNYSSNSNAFVSEQATESAYPEGNFSTKSESNGANGDGRHNISANLNYNNGKIYLRSDVYGSYDHTNNSNASLNNQYGLLRQDLKNNSSSKNSTPSMSGNFNLSKKLKNKRNQLSASGGFSLSNTAGTQNINTNTLYYDQGTGLLQKDSLLNRDLISETNSQSVSLGFNYSIGFKKGKDSLTNRSLNFNYNASASNSRNEVATFVVDNMDSAVSLVDSLSTSYQSIAVNQALGINYNHDSKDTRYNFGLNVRPALIENHDLRLKENFVNNTLNYSPNLNISRSLAKGKTLQAEYAGENNNPNIYQLQPLRNSQNLQNIVVGNPNLKSSFNHRMSANYNYVHAKSNVSVRTGLQANATQMEIVNHVILVPDTLNSLKQITRFENINGNYSFGGNYRFYLPFKNNKYTINYSGSIGMSNRAIIFNNQKAFGKGLNFSQQLQSNFSVKKLRLNMNVSYSKTNNNGGSMDGYLGLQTAGLGQVSAPSFFSTSNFGTEVGGELKLTKFSLQGGATYNTQNNDGPGDQRFRNNSNVNLRLSGRLTLGKSYFVHFSSFKQLSYGYALANANPLILNLTFDRRFLKDKALSLSLAANDLLGQGNNISRVVSGNTIIDSRNRQPTRVFSLNLSYNLSRFAGKTFNVDPD